jgi:tetratricopeptide (TPR) repeat protein
MPFSGFRRSAWIVAIGSLLFAGTFECKAAEDADICANESGDVAIAACSRAIASGRYKEHSLAVQYVNRGVEWKLKKDYDRAFADYSYAIELDPAYADAYYNRCILYNLRDDYDRAVSDCSQSVKLGPTPGAMTSSGAQPLGDYRTSSDYYSERGLAYLKKKDYDRAIADFDVAVRLYSKNARAINNRGLAYQAKGDTARADADFAAAKQINE